MVEFHGIVVYSSSLVANEFQDYHYQNFKKLGINSVCYLWYWTQQRYNRGLELNELLPGVYYQANLDLLRRQVDLCKKHGLTPMISLRVFHHGSGDYGWSDMPNLGFPYVNRNLPDASGTGGRVRFCALIKHLASLFPDCIIDVWNFPGHGQGSTVTEDDEKTFYNVTQPAMLRAVREGGNNMPIILHPLLQGCYAFGWQPVDYTKLIQTGAFLSPNFKTHEDYGTIYYGTNSHENYNLLVALGEPWDQNLDRLKQVWQPAVDFAKTHKVISVEYINLDHHNYPLGTYDGTRLNFARQTMQICKEAGINWTWHRFEDPTTAGLVSTPFEASAPGTTDWPLSPVGTLIKEYAPTPTPPIDLFTAGGVSLIILDAALVAYYIYTRLVE